MSQIRVRIPSAGQDNAPDLVSYFNAQLEGEFAQAIDWSVWEFDERAQVDELAVVGVQVDGLTVQVTYEIQFSAYYGCSDMDYADVDERVIHGVQVGPDWQFQRHVPVPPRTPFEEF